MKPMKEVSVFDAKTHFSGLVDHVYTQQESVTITRRGVKIAKLVPFESEQKQEKKVATVLRELQVFGEEMARVSVTLEDIKKMKGEGRR